MSISNGQMTVGTTAVQVDGNNTNWSHIHIKNLDNSNDLYVGTNGLTVGNGFHVAKQEFFEFDLPPGNSISLITSTGTVQVAWLRIDK